MKKTLKMIAGLAVGLTGGLFIGLFVGVAAAVLFSDKTWEEAFANVFMKVGTTELITDVLWAVVGSVVAFIVQIIVHEGGHLVAGLLTGYRFVSFRIFNLTLIKKDGRFQWRNFSLAGTGGQCLMAPPLRPLSEIDTRWYNLGGVLANIILSTVALLLLYFFDLPQWIEIMLLMLTIFGYLLALLNGIPMKLNGMSNDGYNLLYLEKSPHDKQLLCQMLEANALIQNGKQPKDMPEEMFASEEPVNWKDGLQVNWQMMVVARLENQHRWEEAYALLKEAEANLKHITGLFQKEILSELVFVCLITNRIDEARELYTDDLRKYVQQFIKTQSSKKRVHYAATLRLDEAPHPLPRGGEQLPHSQDSNHSSPSGEDGRGAFLILDDLIAHRNDYLLQGEVDMDIELMQLFK